MASGKGVSDEGFDERLIAARDAALLGGETVVAQEEGDQGQAIILTDSRVLVIKVGITATGAANAVITGAFPIGDVSAVNVRKGPLGAVIQVCTENRELLAQSGPPNNVVVFTGPQRMKRCEAIAARMDGKLSKPVAVAEPKLEAAEEPAAGPTEAVETPEAAKDVTIEAVSAEETPVAEATQDNKPKGGRKARSLAEEMFAEMNSPQDEPAPAHSPVEPVAPPAPSEPEAKHEPVPEPTPEPAREPKRVEQPVVDSAIVDAINEVPEKEPEEELAAAGSYSPNPLLPKPRRRSGGGAKKVLAVFATLTVLLLVGVAVTAPLRVPKEQPKIKVNVVALTNNPQVVVRQCRIVTQYESQVMAIIGNAKQAIAGTESSLRAGSANAAASKTREEIVSKAWDKLSELKAPPGLAGAKENIASGLFIGRTALANLASGAPAGKSETLSRMTEAGSLIAKGLAAIESMQADLQKEASASRNAQDTTK